MAKAIAVERKKAEEVRKKLIEEGLLIQNLKIRRSKEYVYFPVREHVPYGKFIQSMEFDEKEKNYTEVLKSKGLPLHIPIDFIGVFLQYFNNCSSPATFAYNGNFFIHK